MSLKLKHLFSLLLMFGAVAFTASDTKASNPTIHISAKPTWLKTYKPYDKGIAMRDVDNGYFFQLIEEQIHVEKKANYTHVIRQIVSDAGIQNGSEISISFDPSFQQLDLHQVIVWRDNRPQNRLSAAAFKVIAEEKDLDKFIYNGTYSAFCILNDIRKGDKIEYSFTVTGRNPILGNHYCGDIYFQQSQPVAHMYTAVLASAQRKLNFKYFNKVPTVNITEKSGLKNYQWEDFQVKAAHDYDNQPGWYTSYGFVQISDFKDWQEVVNWGLKINPLAANIGGALGKQIASFKEKAGADKEKYFRAAVKMVQDEIRYMGIEMGQYSHRANTPEKVYNQRYGDCKDKSLLLASLLNAGGIPASMVLINAGAKSKTDQYLPSPFVFDHATVTAIVNGKQVWIDPTISYQGGSGLNLYYPHYGKGLIVKAGNDQLTVIPPSKTGKIVCSERFNVVDVTKVRLDVTTIYTDNEADDIREKLASSSVSETEKNYLNYYAKSYPKIESRDSIIIKDDTDKNVLTTIEHYSVPDFFKKDSATNKYAVSFYANYINDQITAANNKSQYPLALNYPANVDYTMSVVLPSGWNVEPSNYSLKRDAYSFASDSKAKDDTLILNYRLSYLNNFIPVDKLGEYREDIKHIKDNELSYSFMYTPGITNANYRLNYWMVLSVGCFVLLLCYIGFKIYRTETPEIVFEPGAGFSSLGGWLVVIAIGLCISILAKVVSLSDGIYFDLDKWNAHLYGKTEYRFKALFAFEAFGNVLLLGYACFCLILLLNKRDIFPRFIIGLYIYAIAFLIADYVFVRVIYPNFSEEKALTSIIRTMVIAVIWIPYFLRSKRVEETFIVPYPAHRFSFMEVQPEQPTGSDKQPQ